MRCLNKDLTFFDPLLEVSENSQCGGLRTTKLEEYDQIDQKKFFRPPMLKHRVRGAVWRGVQKVKLPIPECV